MKTQKILKVEGSETTKPIEVKVLGYFSTITGRTYTRKSDRARAEKNLKEKRETAILKSKLTQLTNKYNTKKQ